MLDAERPRRYTYDDYCQWQGDERWELIDGEAFLMSPAPRLRHQSIVGELNRQLANFLLDKPCRVFVAPVDVRLPHGDESDHEVDTVVQPDLVVVCDSEKLDDAGVRGAPDLVVEILSPATASRDEILKRDLYQRHGVREYWLVDPAGPGFRIYRNGAGGFVLQSSLASSVLPGFELDLRRF
jgi:Uma2 family endonuclease